MTHSTGAIIEKSTMVRMALAFAVAVKHYLRGEEGM
jgi:putative membrane protein